MSFEIIPILPFQRQAKRLIKKSPSLKNEVLTLIETLKENPHLGTPLGFDCYKIRLSIASKNKGDKQQVFSCQQMADNQNSIPPYSKSH